MQKAIRRGLGREPIEFACELIHPSKGFHSMVCNRLEVICHEDLDSIATSHVVPFVAAAAGAVAGALRQEHRRSPPDGRQLHQAHVPGAALARRMSLRCAIGLRSMLEDFAPTIPDWANDQHTLAGRKLGRGLDHFRQGRRQAGAGADRP
ncbi:hypothetical protein QCM80_02535 [Bradyrhizobium sp. SSUT112]|uniref:hypothetical protein n=1 Tax=Bradyrhizobium sp. SSUT112 TaxID=3040604 RepID=UPI002448C3A9|nr:hypothetical protein [Bradyrhizobium sp. SSUT112]MDH2349561.1 hypothetical protein [Bradyrhizobium sp. SSUT112]